MNYTLLTTLLFIVFSCNKQTTNKEDTIKSLVHKIDSLSSNHQYDKTYELLVNRLYEMDSTNIYGIKCKINIEYNNGNDSLTVQLFQKLSKSIPKSSYYHLFYVLSLERMGYQDSSNKHYEYLLENISDSLNQKPFNKYELLTILYGKDSAMNEFKKVPISDSYKYLFIKNSIENYSNLGMHDLLSFPDTVYIPDEYYVIIPDSLYTTGKLNSMNKLYSYFVKKGINIYHVGTDTRNHAFKFRSKPIYKNKIMNISSLSIQQINNL